jgi:hypothetical protein
LPRKEKERVYAEGSGSVSAYPDHKEEIRQVASHSPDWRGRLNAGESDFMHAVVAQHMKHILPLHGKRLLF